MPDTQIKIKCAFIHCMDYRIQETLQKLRESEGVFWGEFDRISFAGGAGDFEGLEEQLALSSKLHDPQFVILTIHKECGGGATEEDFSRAEVIAKKYVSEVRMFYVNLDGTFRRVKNTETNFQPQAETESSGELAFSS
jgi:hypothetical protein